MESRNTMAEAVCLWQATHSIGRKPTTQHFNDEIAEIVRDNWTDLKVPVLSITASDVLTFAEKVAHYCPSRWNALVSLVRSVTPHGDLLKRKKLRLRHFVPPEQPQFEKFLAECDAIQRSHAGLVVRFLCLTGLRPCEAYKLRWEHVLLNRIDIPADVSAKNDRARSLPMVEGLREVLDRLRALTETGFVLPRGNVKATITKAAKRAGLKWSPYVCRHYYATRCIECGVDVPTVSRWMGHSDGGTQLSVRYFHLMDSHSVRMAERVRIAA